MYQVDEKDIVVKLDAAPQSSVGAPLPLLVSDEHKAVLAFYMEDMPEGWDGTTVRVISYDAEEPVALIEFTRCYAQLFGPPNDEAFSGHPLAHRGLQPYGAYEVLNSSWLRGLERMNAVHPHHKPERFWERHHYIFAFHDSTFECVANGFEVIETRGSLKSALPLMAERLWAS